MKNLSIQKLRKLRGLSQAELAEKAGLSQPAIGAIEAGKKSPTLRTLEKLAAALGVKVTDLLEEQAS
jgi:transcriptional regulator with XRE-family HTH domain